MEPDSIADREMRIDYAPAPIGGQGQSSRADHQIKLYNSFNSQPFPQILASLSRPLQPLQHAYKVFNTLARSREESRREGEEFLLMKLSSAHRHWGTLRYEKFSRPSTATGRQTLQKYFCVRFLVRLLEINDHLYALSAVGADEELVGSEDLCRHERSRCGGGRLRVRLNRPLRLPG